MISSHEPMKERLISLERLQLFVKLGLRVTQIHRVFKFEQKNIFNKFIQRNIELRRNAKNTFEKDLYKLLNNAIYGKLLYNARKHDLEVKIVSNKQTFARLVKDPFLHSVESIGDGKLLMKFKAKKIELKYPLFCGWAVLELSKCIMYDMFYNKLRQAYGPSTKLLYSDTDSFIIKILGKHSFLEGINHPSLKGFMDTSNFPEDHPDFSNEFKGKLGAIKSETKDEPISEFNGLSPKCYSLLMGDTSTKSTAKGINRSQQRLLTHQKYSDMLFECKNLRVSCVNIMSKNLQLHTVRTEKLALSVVDRKRYWFPDHSSRAFGHYSLDPTPKPVKIKKQPKKQNPHNLNHALGFDFNYRRGMNPVFESVHPTSGLYHVNEKYPYHSLS